MYQVIVQYLNYHQYLRRQNELCLLNLLITLCPLLLLINIKVRILLIVLPKLPFFPTFMINDILIYLGNKASCYIVLLNLSSACDSLDYNILFIGLNEISIHSQIHSLFMYFVSPRTSSVKINSSLYPPYFNIDGVPQGSVLGSILFIIYIFPIKSIFFIKYPIINYHIYADDLQIYSHFLVLVILV